MANSLKLPIGSVDFNALHDVLTDKKADEAKIADAASPVNIGGIKIDKTASEKSKSDASDTKKGGK